MQRKIEHTIRHILASLAGYVSNVIYFILFIYLFRPVAYFVILMNRYQYNYNMYLQKGNEKKSNSCYKMSYL